VLCPLGPACPPQPALLDTRSLLTHLAPQLALPPLLARLSPGTFDKFKASSWGKKLARQQAKAAMNDFDRFKATATKVKKARVVRKVFNQLKKASQKK
jgi:hypothetical protein